MWFVVAARKSDTVNQSNSTQTMTSHRLSTDTVRQYDHPFNWLRRWCQVGVSTWLFCI